MLNTSPSGKTHNRCITRSAPRSAPVQWTSQVDPRTWAAHPGRRSVSGRPQRGEQHEEHRAHREQTVTEDDQQGCVTDGRCPAGGEGTSGEGTSREQAGREGASREGASREWASGEQASGE
jgi:hypothetical protein